MTTLIVGDVHGCARELDKLLRRVQPDRTVLVGDLFTRGPDPRGVWSLIREWGAEAVLGNHDLAVLDRWKPGKELPKKAFRWLRKRPTAVVGQGWLVIHAAVDPRGLEHTSRKVATGLRRAPSKWHRDWRGDLVVHGHRSGKTVIDRRPYTLGLDTACVRGGRLTGYVVEDDEIVSVKAKRAYR